MKNWATKAELLSVVQKADLSSEIKKSEGRLDPNQREKVIYNQIVTPPIMLEVKPMSETNQNQMLGWSQSLQ